MMAGSYLCCCMMAGFYHVFGYDSWVWPPLLHDAKSTSVLHDGWVLPLLLHDCRVLGLLLHDGWVLLLLLQWWLESTTSVVLATRHCADMI
jgi:cation transport regulator ChaC